MSSRRAASSAHSAIISASLWLLLTLSFVPFVCGQNYFTIDPNAVDLQTKQTWCREEIDSCGILCTDQENSGTNNCNPNTLVYQCTCSSGYSPLMQFYADTLPTLICQEYLQECMLQNSDSLKGQQNCTNTIGQLCSTKKPQPLNSASWPSSSTTSLTSSTSSTSSSSSASSSETDTSSKTTTSSSSASTSTDTGTSSPAEALKDDSPSGLSSSAKVGIGVGAGLGGALLLGALGFLALRTIRRRRAQKFEEERLYQKPELDNTQIDRYQAPWVNESGGREVMELADTSIPAQLRVAVSPTQDRSGESIEDSDSSHSPRH